MFSIQLIAYGVMYLKTGKTEIIFFYLAQVILFLAVIALYTILYPNVSRVVINNMCMLLSIGFIMILRLNTEKAIKQFIFVWNLDDNKSDRSGCHTKDEVVGGMDLYLCRRRSCGTCTCCSICGDIRRGKTWVFCCRDQYPAVGVCKDLVCIFCGGESSEIDRL
mgnify:CR=1 FL=1